MIFLNRNSNEKANENGGENIMKIIKIIILSTILFNSMGMSLQAEEHSGDIPEGFESWEQYEQAPDYNDPERVEARNAKLVKSASIEENPKLRAGGKYTIGIGLIGQETKYYCGPATGKMLIDYQLGKNNTWTQKKIAGNSYMKTDKNQTTYTSDAAAALRNITKLNFEAQRISEVPLKTALKTDINAYVGLYLVVDINTLYPGYNGGGHAVAAKGYSDTTVIYNDPYKYINTLYGTHEVSISKMTNAIKNEGGLYIW